LTQDVSCEVAQDSFDKDEVCQRWLRPLWMRFETDLEPKVFFGCECVCGLGCVGSIGGCVWGALTRFRV
jgi:hypothetical protein